MDTLHIRELKKQFLSSTNILAKYEKKHVSLYRKWMQSTNKKLKDYEPWNIYQNSTSRFIFLIMSPEVRRQVGIVQRPVGMVHLILQQSNIIGAPLIGILSVTIGIKKFRRNGLGFKAVKLMMKFGREYLGVSKFRAHMGGANSACLNLFESRLRFRRVEFVLGQWTLESSDSWEMFEKYEGPPEIDLGAIQWGENRTRDTSDSNPNPRR